VIVAGKFAKIELKDQSQAFCRVSRSSEEDEFVSNTPKLHTNFCAYAL
jgi:hypothetical protein